MPCCRGRLLFCAVSESGTRQSVRVSTLLVLLGVLRTLGSRVGRALRRLCVHLRLLHKILDGSRTKMVRTRGDAPRLLCKVVSHVTSNHRAESSRCSRPGKLLDHQPNRAKLADARGHGAMRVMAVRRVDVLLGMTDIPANHLASPIEDWTATVPLEHRRVREQELACSSCVASVHDAIADDAHGWRHRTARRAGISE